MYTFFNVELPEVLNNINNQLFIVTLMLGITMVFVCIFAFHISTSLYELKQIKKELETKKTTKKQVKQPTKKED